MIGLSYKQKCNNFGYLSIEVWLKGNDTIRETSFIKGFWTESWVLNINREARPFKNWPNAGHFEWSVLKWALGVSNGIGKPDHLTTEQIWIIWILDRFWPHHELYSSTKFKLSTFLSRLLGCSRLQSSARFQGNWNRWRLRRAACHCRHVARYGSTLRGSQSARLCSQEQPFRKVRYALIPLGDLWPILYSWDQKSDHSKSRNIQIPDFLKVGFKMVPM